MIENINFDTKHFNPPNVPQARSIENFWGYLAQKVYAGGWEAKTDDPLVSRIGSKLKEFDSSYVESLMMIWSVWIIFLHEKLNFI